MATKIKTTLLTGLFFFGLLTGLQAQDKYKYAFMEAPSNPNSFIISIDGTELKTIEINKPELKSVGAYNLMIREVKIMEADGWELLDTHVIPIASSTGQTFYYNFFFQFRKKV